MLQYTAASPIEHCVNSLGGFQKQLKRALEAHGACSKAPHVNLWSSAGAVERRSAPKLSAGPAGHAVARAVAKGASSSRIGVFTLCFPFIVSPRFANIGFIAPLEVCMSTYGIYICISVVSKVSLSVYVHIYSVPK